MSKSYIIVGSGFRGFCDALQLVNNGDKVHIIDAAPFSGGIGSSVELKGFNVDKGVHIFDSMPEEFGSIINEVMDGKVKTLGTNSASVFNKVVTHGYSLPDLSSLSDEIKNKILLELIDLAAEYDDLQKNPDKAVLQPKNQNLAELLVKRFGATATGIYAGIFKRLYSADAADVEDFAIDRTSLGRLKFMDDPQMMVLKSHPWMETVLAATRKTIGEDKTLFSYYPTDGEAMNGWCKHSDAWLQTKGVKISLGENILSITQNANNISVKTKNMTIEADRIIWANDNVSSLGKVLGWKGDLGQYQSGTPMVVSTLITKAENVNDLTYVQNFDPDTLTYRTCAAGLISEQIKEDGSTFITCESPTEIGGDMWNEPEKYVQDIWQEAIAVGMIKSASKLLDYDFLKAPKTFKVNRIGYNDHLNELGEFINKSHDRILIRNPKLFFRRQLWNDSLKLLEILDDNKSMVA